MVHEPSRTKEARVEVHNTTHANGMRFPFSAAYFFAHVESPSARLQLGPACREVHPTHVCDTSLVRADLVDAYNSE